MAGFQQATKKNLRLYLGFSYNYKARAQHAKPLWAPRKPNKCHINVESIKTKTKQVFIIKLCVCCWWHALAFQTFCRQIYLLSKLCEIEYFLWGGSPHPLQIHIRKSSTNKAGVFGSWLVLHTLHNKSELEDVRRSFAEKTLDNK